MPEIVLCDPYLSGHHLSYLRIYSSVFLEIGCKVAVLCEDVERVGSYLSELKKASDGRLRILALRPRKISRIEINNRKRRGFVRDLVESFTAFQNFKQVGDSAKSHGLGKDSLILFMWLDSCISKYMLPVFLRFILPYKWGGLFFHPGHIKYDQESNVYYRDLLHYIPIFDSKKLMFIGLFDKRMVERLRIRQQRNVFNWLPDVAEENSLDFDSELVGSMLDAAGSRKIVSLVGSLGKRKNLVSYFDVAKNCKNDDLFYVCVGQLHKDTFNEDDLDFIYKTAEDCRDKLFFYDQHVEKDSVFDTIFYLSSVVVAVYDRFASSSNIITKAAMHKKGIIVADDHLMGEIIHSYKIGLCVKSGDVQDLREAIEKLLDANTLCDESFKLYTNDFSVKNLKKLLSVCVH